MALAGGVAVAGLFGFTYFWPRDLIDLVVDNRTGVALRVSCPGTGLNLTVPARSRAEDRIYRGTERAILGEPLLGVHGSRRIKPKSVVLENRWTATQLERRVRIVFE